VLESAFSLHDLSPLLRDYLAEIYQANQIELNGHVEFLSSATLAERFATSQTTVNRVIERLREAELIEHERYIGVRLTMRGQREARQVLRKQSVIETFLVNVMGFQWHDVYPEARQMRHHVSAEPHVGAGRASPAQPFWGVD
jgi:DtxR family Mn-dependent transcriptional regulator